MFTNKDQDRFHELVARVLDPSCPAYTLRPEVLELSEIMCRGAGFELVRDSSTGSGETRQGSGLAISPTLAAMCAEDYARTVVFLRGLHEAVTVAQTRIEGDRRVRVLDAGCGPLGLLSVPLMAVLPRVRFSMIDLHIESIDSCGRLIEALGLTRSVERLEVADATSIRLDPHALPDVIVTETMTAALENEPQVAISRNLIEQAPDAVLVPASVRVEGMLIDPAREFLFVEPNDEMHESARQRERLPMGTAFEITAEAIRSWQGHHADSLPGGTLRVPDPRRPEMQPMLFTTVRVFGEHLLKEYDSGLTMPRAFPNGVEFPSGARIEARYRLGERPGLEFNPVEHAGDE